MLFKLKVARQETNETIFNFSVYKITSNLDVICLLMKFRILSNIYGRFITYIYQNWSMKIDMKIFEQIRKLLWFTSVTYLGSILGSRVREIIVCFLHIHEIREESRNKQKFKKGLRVVGQVVQSKSTKLEILMEDGQE